MIEDPYASAPLINAPSSECPEDWIEVKCAPMVFRDEATARAIEDLTAGRDDWIYGLGARRGFSEYTGDFSMRLNSLGLGRLQAVYYFRDPQLAMLFKLTWGGK